MSKYLKSSSLFPFLQTATNCGMEVTFVTIVKCIYHVLKKTSNILWSKQPVMFKCSKWFSCSKSFFKVLFTWKKNMRKGKMKYDLWTANWNTTDQRKIEKCIFSFSYITVVLIFGVILVNKTSVIGDTTYAYKK